MNNPYLGRDWRNPIWFEEQPLTEDEWREVLAVPELRRRYGVEDFESEDLAWFRRVSRAMRVTWAPGVKGEAAAEEYVIMGPTKPELACFRLQREEGVLRAEEVAGGEELAEA